MSICILSFGIHEVKANGCHRFNVAIDVRCTELAGSGAPGADPTTSLHLDAERPDHRLPRAIVASLLLEGEMLEGGWQHRVLDCDLLLDAGGSYVAPVSCVEHGRWHGGEVVGGEAHPVEAERKIDSPRAATAASTGASRGGVGRELR